MERAGDIFQRKAAEMMARREEEKKALRSTLELAKASASEAQKNALQLYAYFGSEFMAIAEAHKPKKKCSVCGSPLEAAFDRYECWWTVLRCEKCMVDEVTAAMREKAPEILSSRGLSKRYMAASFSKLPKAVQAVADESAYLYGSVGTGKTYAMAAMMLREAMAIRPIEDRYQSLPDEIQRVRYHPAREDSYPVFVSTPRFLLAIRSTFRRQDSDDTEESVISRYAKASGTLYLDDIGAEQATDWARQALYLLLDERYSEERRTVISGNLSLEELAHRLDDRIASRIAGMCKVVEIKGADRRIRAAKGGLAE
jgi:DNA replication protein DnaC